MGELLGGRHIFLLFIKGLKSAKVLNLESLFMELSFQRPGWAFIFISNH